MTTTPYSLTAPLHSEIARVIGAEGGWIGFDRYMALALYTPGLGYYANDGVIFSQMPAAGQHGAAAAGGDFVTAPEMSPLFGQTLAKQVAQALQRTQTDEIWEFGAGSGALAEQLLDERVPLRGICLYPILGMPEWHARDQWTRMGLWDLEREQDVLERRACQPMVDALHFANGRVRRGLRRTGFAPFADVPALRDGARGPGAAEGGPVLSERRARCSSSPSKGASSRSS